MTLPLDHGGVTIVIQRGTPDRFNDRVFADVATIPGCLEYPAGSTENQGGAVTDERVVLAPSGSDIRASDRVKMNGLIYQVQGVPKDWEDPFTTWAPGMQVSLVRVT